MQTIYELITLEYQNEHDLEHTLGHKTQFSTPKIFDANGNLKKRWYVYFSYRHPETGKLVRQKNIYGKANRFKTKSERYSVLNLYKKRLLKYLKEGYSPYADNNELYQKQSQKQNNNSNNITTENKTVINSHDSQKSRDNGSLNKNEQNDNNKKQQSITKAFARAIELKTNIVNATTLVDYKSRINQLENWLGLYFKETVLINDVTKVMVVEFLNKVQLKTSARNRNNYRTVFSSIFQVLEDNEIIEKNFIKSIGQLRTKPKRNKTYSNKEQELIFDYLESNDPLLLLYIKFIGYNLLRPIEVNRLKIKDINIAEGKLQFQAKNKELKTKIIPEILLSELPDLSKFNENDILFTPNGIGDIWDSKLTNRRDYFSKRFKRVVKDHFGFDNNYGLYSIRHTFITKLYRAMVKDSSPFEAKSKLMHITGHTTMTALEKYLRDIDAELPDDYSDFLQTNKY